jgi:hypothetical protein
MTTLKKAGAPKGPKRVQITTTLDPKTRAKLKKINPIIGKAIDELAKGDGK